MGRSRTGHSRHGADDVDDGKVGGWDRGLADDRMRSSFRRSHPASWSLLAEKFGGMADAAADRDLCGCRHRRLPVSGSAIRALDAEGSVSTGRDGLYCYCLGLSTADLGSTTHDANASRADLFP